MSDFFMNGNWMLDMLERHIWHGFVVGTVALAIVYTVCRLFRKMPPDIASWLYRLGYLKLITAFVFLRAISVTVPVYAPVSPASTAGMVMQMSRGTSVSSVSTAHSAGRQDAVLYLMMLWGLGVILAGIRIGFASYRTRTLRKSCSVIEDEVLQRTLVDLCERMGIRRKPELLSGNVCGPMICGFLSPSIILPQERSSGEDLHLVLAHELAHVKRRDVMWAWLPMLAQWFFFFNPLVWLLRKEWFFAQEAACDAMAIDVTSASHAEYGQMLLNHVVPIPAGRRLVAIGVSEPYNTLKRRLSVMLKSQSGLRRRNVLIGAVVLAIGIIASVFAVSVRSQLPAWAPRNPSPEFIRAAKVLKPLPSGSKHTDGPLDVPQWECFGTLTDQQLKDFMKIRQVKLLAANLSPESISRMKQRKGATESGGYIVYNKREISVPVKDMSAAQRESLDRVVRAWYSNQPSREDGLLEMLYKAGAAKDLSNVDLVFNADGGHEVWFSFCVTQTLDATGPEVQTRSTFCTIGPFGYINR